MSFLTAINSIEKIAEKLKLKYPDGTLLEGVVALGYVGHFHGERFDSLLDRLTNRSITVDEYYLEMIKMIREYQDHLKDKRRELLT